RARAPRRIALRQEPRPRVGVRRRRLVPAPVPPHRYRSEVNDTDARAALRGTTIAALLLASAQAPLGSTMIAVGIPGIARALGSDATTTTSLLVTSYLSVNIIGQSPGGKLGDVLGHATTVRLGMALYAVGALAGF